MTDNMQPSHVWDNPKSFSEAIKRADAKEWQKAWEVELANMKRLGVLEQCDEPADTNICGSKLVCKIKRLASNVVDKVSVVVRVLEFRKPH